jgi:two-component system response regulator DctR
MNFEDKLILVVDDNPDIVYTIEEICTFIPCRTISANNGMEGLELFKKHRPQLVIVDYHMANWNGIKTVDEIRKIDDTVSILVLTVDERQEISEKFMEVGATDFSVKPIKAADLISRIKMNFTINEMQLKNKEIEKRVYIEKGISSATLSILTDYLRKQNKELKISDISEGVGLAYQTVHRYINYLSENGLVKKRQIYGKIGRPQNYYKII